METLASRHRRSRAPPRPCRTEERARSWHVSKPPCGCTRAVFVREITPRPDAAVAVADEERAAAMAPLDRCKAAFAGVAFTLKLTGFLMSLCTFDSAAAPLPSPGGGILFVRRVGRFRNRPGTRLRDYSGTYCPG